MFRDMFTSEDNRILAGSSIDFYTHVQKDLGVDIGVDPIGYLWLMSEEQLSTSERHLERMMGSGVEIRRYDSRQLQSMIRGLKTDISANEESKVMRLEDVSGGVFGTNCGRLAPERLTGYYRDQFLELGGKTRFGADAKSSS